MTKSRRDQLSTYSILVVLNLNNWIYLDDPENTYEPPSFRDPEVELLKKEREKIVKTLEGLSSESRFLVQTILQLPDEIIESLRDGRGANRISSEKLAKFLKKEFKIPWKVIYNSFKEIKDWLNFLSEYPE